MIKSHELLGRIGKVAYSTFTTVCHSYETAYTVGMEMLPGAIVECGVAAGAQMAAMMAAGRDCGDIDRKYYLFDSFCGIPLAGPNDENQPGIGEITHDVNVPEKELLKSSGISSVSVDGVKKNFDNWGLKYDNAVFVEGWFQDTIPDYPIGDIAILRLDGDLYASTKVCLEWLWPKVINGGYIIIDDYALTGCRKAIHEYFGDYFAYNVVDGTNTVIWWRK